YGAVNFDRDGNLYTTAIAGGLNGVGAVLRLSHKPPRVIAYSFGLDKGYGPVAGVLIDPRNNNLYGTTSLGGPNDAGGVYRIASKHETELYSFTGGDDGGQPVAALIADKDGNLYGTAKAGGTSNNGVVFEITH
ncbi:MAG: choice-of-anchor tandem repeat GloVer-containing protein, partial [Candidatus Dormibacteraceae bacterium]